MDNVETPSTDLERVERVRAWIQALLDRYAAYHQHKEGTAYAAITLFAGIAGTAAVGNAWPPAWGRYTTVLAISAATLLWGAVLTFLRFQLTRRRWAALRVAGCDRLLAVWLQKAPSDVGLAPATPTSRPPVPCPSLVANCLWGSKYAVHAVDTSESVYPSALVTAWVDQETRGTDALKHERLILVSGWVLYVVLVVTTIIRHRVDVAV